MSKVLKIIICSLSLHLCPSAHGQSPSDLLINLGQPSVTSFSAKRYQAHPNNYDVIQDKDGILYFGNLWCVLQFDGTVWRKIILPNGASCTSLALGDDGTIYVGGRNSIGYLKTDSIGRKYYVSMLDDLPPEDQLFSEVWRTVATKEGTFFSSFDRLFIKTRGGKLQQIREKPWYIFRVKNKVFINAGDGLFNYVDDKLKRVVNSESYNGKFITAMTHLNDKLLICTAEDGLSLFDGKRALPWNTPINQIIQGFNPTRIENVNDRYIIISTELNGVIIADINGNIIHNFNKSNGLSVNTVSGFLLGKNNLLWLTLSNGIASVPLFKQINYLNDYQGIAGIPYSSALYNNRLYLATSEGLFFKDLHAKNMSRTFERVKGIQGLVWNLHVIDNRLFCGHAIRGYMIDQDNKVVTICQEGTWMFLKSREKNKILTGTYGGIHYLSKENGQWQYESKIKGFTESARSFTEDKFGDLWVSYGKLGVYRLRVDRETDSITQIKKFENSENLPLKNGSSITQYNDAILITTEKGIYQYNFEQEKIYPFTALNRVLTQNGLLHIKKIIPESNVNLWVIDNQGALVKLQFVKDSIIVKLKTELLRGNIVADFEHINPLPNPVVIGSLEGFALYNQNEITQDDTLHAFISKVETNSLVLADGDYNISKIKEPIPYSENVLKFTFASNSYQDLNNNQYQYFLEGFSNQAWSTPTYLAYKEYTNLNPGNYTLHVRTINFENRVSEESTLTFKVLPPWYLSWWAYAFYGILFTVFNYVFFKKIKARIENEKKRITLEEQHNLWLKQREWEEISLNNKKTMMALQQEKLQIEKAALAEKEQLIEKEKERERQLLAVEKEKLEADIRYKNNELTSLTLHIAQKNEILTKLSSQLNRTIHECKDEAIGKILKEMKVALLKGINSENEWEKFANHFDAVHEGFLKRLKQKFPDLSSSALMLCAFIKMRLSSKQISSLMNTEPDSVLKARYRLRIKFGLDKETGLEEFLNSF